MSEVTMEMITSEICEEIVNKHFSGRVVNFKLQAIGGEKKGALGEYYNLEIETTEVNLKLFVKTVLRNPNRPQFTNLVTYKENQFYALVERLKENVRNLDTSFMPRCHMQTDKFLVLEDVGGENLCGKLEVEDVNVVLEKLAKLHTCSIVWEQLYKTSLSNEGFLKEALFSTDTNFVGSSYVSGIVNGICKLLVLENFEDDAIVNFRNLSNQALAVFNGNPQFTSVCCHGDLWSNNVLYLQEGDCKLIDFQMIRYAPPAHDVNMLIYLNCSKKTIRNHLEDFTENYYKYLRFELIKHNINISDVINKNDYLSSFKYFCNISKFVRVFYKGFKAATRKRTLSKIMKPLDIIMRENEANFIVDVMEIDECFKGEVLEILDDLRMSLRYPDFPPECCFMVMNRFLREYELLDYSLEELDADKKFTSSQDGEDVNKIHSVEQIVYKVYKLVCGVREIVFVTILLPQSSANEYILRIMISGDENQEHTFLLTKN